MKNLYLTAILLSSTVFAETTGNLITNGAFDNGTTGWTLSGNTQRINDCCPGGHDLEFGNSGSIEQSFDLLSNTITQPMLDNGITLNSSVEVQNGECSVSGCWGGSGPADTFTIRLQIKDINNNVLAVTTQERTNVTGINGKDFTDSVSFSGTGSNQGNIFISGADGNSPAYLGGPNVDNISVTMTYDPTVLSATQTEEITTAITSIEEIIELTEEIIPVELFTEEFIIEEPTFEIQPEIIEIVEIKEEEKFVEETLVLSVLEAQPVSEVEETIVEQPEEIVEEIVEEVYEENNEPEMEVKNEESSIEEEVGERETGGSEQGSTESEVVAENTEATENTNTSVEESRNNESTTVANENISVDNIEQKVNQTIKRIDQRLVATSLIVAKAMKSDISIDNYGQINNNIFINQPFMDGGSYYETRNYIDNRNVYAENQGVYNDVVFRHQEQIEKADDELIRAQENLRRIKDGF